MSNAPSVRPEKREADVRTRKRSESTWRSPCPLDADKAQRDAARIERAKNFHAGGVQRFFVVGGRSEPRSARGRKKIGIAQAQADGARLAMMFSTDLPNRLREDENSEDALALMLATEQEFVEQR